VNIPASAPSDTPEYSDAVTIILFEERGLVTAFLILGTGANMNKLEEALEKIVLDVLQERDIEADYNSLHGRASMYVIMQLVEKGEVLVYHREGRTLYALAQKEGQGAVVENDGARP
jgi:hypothetical protein